jgi:zinc/manganese transport system substrate-binding protein
MVLSAAACGDDESDAASSGERPKVVVTTNIIGDMVGEVIGEEADVEVIMPLGSDPHDFEPSARQAEAIEEADLLVVNGAGFEEGLLGVIESAEKSGTPVFAFADEVKLLEFTGEHAEEEEDEHAGEEEGTDDPHIWTDPARMITAVEAVAARLGELEGVDAEVIDSQATAYVDELESLDGDIETMMGEIPDERRVLVTNHEVFGYFADRYGFDVVGAVVPSLSTNAEASAGELTALAELIATEGVPAIFAETTQSTELADALADEAGGDVEVVELFSESLGESGSGAETYLDMMRTNAERIVEALA